MSQLSRQGILATIIFLVLMVVGLEVALTEAQLYIGPYSRIIDPIAPRAWIHGYGRVR